ncbi:monocarboxylate transporter 7-like [Diadema antillarum]|uniref:monocarboxylate transporter 7-like n=1 Tax=Diadema antillarum TaxID=105358 RepID=UPI003A84E202
MFRRVKTGEDGQSTAPRPPARKTTCNALRCQAALLILYAHLCLFFGIGISTSLTVFLDDIVQELDSSVATLGIFFSVRSLTFGITSPLASYLTKRWGSRVVVMAGGLLTGVGVLMTAWASGVALVGVGVICFTGIGSAFVYIATLISIRRNFPTHRSYALANGITVSGSSLAVSVFAPIARVLSHAYSWRGSVLICSAVILHTMVFGLLLRDRKVIPKRPKDVIDDGASAIALINNRDSGVTLEDSSPARHYANGVNGSSHVANGEGQYAESSLVTSVDSQDVPELAGSNGHLSADMSEDRRSREPILADKQSTLIHGILLLVIFLSTSSYSAVFVYLAAAGEERGLSPIRSASLLSATGISQAVVRFGHGFLVTVGLIKPLPLYIVVQFIMTIGILVLGVFQEYSVGCIGAVMFGIGTGSVRSLNLVVQRVVDARAGSKAVGLAVLVSEVAAAVGGLFAGLLRDRSGDYMTSFMVACGMTFAASVLTVIIALLRRIMDFRTKTHSLPQ